MYFLIRERYVLKPKTHPLPSQREGVLAYGGLNEDVSKLFIYDSSQVLTSSLLEGRGEC